MNLEQILEQIDSSRLKRDYQANPLKRKSRLSEKVDLPFKEDLEYLYIEKNFSQQELSVYFSLATIGKVIRSFGIEKPLSLKHQCRARQNLEKYGVDSPSKLESVQNKAKQTCLNRYGNESANRLKWKKDKCIRTCLTRYGTINVSKVDSVRNKISTGIKNAWIQNGKHILEKREQTNMQRFGVPANTQTKQWKNLWTDACWKNSVMEKQYRTKKKNNSFHASKPEGRIYELLLQKFPEVKRQYRDKRYPFACDFYIPSIDLFIEYNGFWTHGFHSFNENNNEDIKTLEKWKQLAEQKDFKNKNKNLYKNAIKVWTVSDTLKRATASKNNLNFLEFFSEKEFEDWFLVQKGL